MFAKYLLLHHLKELLEIMRNEDMTKHYTINISFVELFEADSDLGNNILKRPEIMLKEFDLSLQVVQQKLLDVHENITKKRNIHTRIYGLPVCSELHKHLLPGNEDLGLFMQISGTVVRVTFPKMLEFEREYICTKCKYRLTVEADLEQRYIIVPPKLCSNPESCKGTTFALNDKLDVARSCRDYQEVKVQERLSKLGTTKMPSSMWVVMEDDLVDTCKPGDNVTICGILKRRWRPPSTDKVLKVELVFKANHVQVNNDNSSLSFVTPDIRDQYQKFWDTHKANPLEGRHIILKSICPELYGLFITKLALAVVLAGGSQVEQSDGAVTTRSQPHLLLVGDPGTGKSELLRFASKVIPRSVLTTGIGSTSAGLTASAVMDDGEWQLEGGALVMADGGICCIDEFNSMKKQDRVSIHEAMEQQTISVAKAGVVCKLRTRCTVLAATNPKNGVDSMQPFGMNVNIASPLLSRFDIVLHLKDNFEQEWDNLVADFVLNGGNLPDSEEDSGVWNIEMLQSYFMIIKQLNPVLTPGASEILSSYYQAQRVVASRHKARTTVRLLDSLIRLSQGHARLMFHQEVQLVDAVVAVMLIEASLQGDSSLLSLEFNLSANFPDNATVNQYLLARIILEKLNLLHLLEQTEDNTKNDNNHFDSDKKVTRRCDESDGNEKQSLKSFNVGEGTSGSNNKDENCNSNKVVVKHEKVGLSISKSHSVKKCTAAGEKESPIWINDEDNDQGEHCEPIPGTSKQIGKLSQFRFKPPIQGKEDGSGEIGLDINQMLNMIPSVATDFNAEDSDSIYGLSFNDVI